MGAELRVNGKTYQLFKQVDGQISIDTFGREIRITVTQQQNNESVMKVNDFLEVFRDGIKDFTGYAEKIKDTENRTNHDIAWRGRSLVADLIDSSVPQNVKSLEGVTKYSELVQLCIDGLGLTDTIKVIDNVGAVFPDSKKPKAAATGDKCGAFLQENARIVQVFLNDDGNGNVVITRPTGRKLKTVLQNIPGARNNNIKSSDIDIDYSQRFNKYSVFSNSSLASDSATANDIDNSGEAFDTEIRKSRVFEKTAEKPMTSAQCKSSAEEEANIRRARSFGYKCSVAGFSANGELWEPGPEVNVKDTVKGVAGLFLVNTVSWAFGDGGEISNMDITLPDKLTVQPDPAVVTKRVSVPSDTYNAGASSAPVNFGVSLDSTVSSTPQVSAAATPALQTTIPTTSRADREREFKSARFLR